MKDPSQTPREPVQTARPRRSNTVSNLFAVAAVIFGIVAIVLYLRNPGGGVAPVPTPAPGGSELVNVTDVLRAQGLEIEQPPGLFIPRGALDAPGQGIRIDGNPGFIFLYPDTDDARADAAADPDAIVPERLGGTPAPEGERRLAQGGNVIVLLVGGSDETWQKVETAVASIP